jgi:hypothetical protein
MAIGDSILDFGKSSAALKSKWISLMRKRFEENRADGAEPSDLNAGIIGISMDFMSNAIEDTWHDMNARSKEIFPTVAKFDDSVYLHATTVHIEDFFAKPAIIDVVIAIQVRDIIRQSVARPDLGYNMLTLSANTQLVLDRFFYKLDYPIDIIYKQGINNQTIISAKYDLSSINPFSDINSTFVIGKTQLIDGVEYYIFKTVARQVALNSQEITYTPASNDTDIFTFPYTSQLAGFDVFYRENDTKPWIQLEKLYQGVLLQLSPSKKFCYYRLLNDDTFDISFSANPLYFSPAFNSRIRVDTYITEGKAGNFVFTSQEIQLIFNQNFENIFEAAFAGIQPVVQLLSEKSRDGENKLTLDEIRQKVVEYRSSREFISSSADLDRYLSQYGFKPSKQRDDILMREFLAYSVLEDIALGFIAPSRTGELYFKEEETIDMPEIDARIMNPANVYQFWLSDEIVSYNFTRFVIAPPDDNGNNPTIALANKDWSYLWNKLEQYQNVLMMCPYLIKIFKDPYFVALYDVQTDANLGVVFGYNNINSPEKFAINSVRIIRNDIRDTSYRISIEISVSDIIMEEFLTVQDLTDFRVRVKMELLKDNKSTYGYITMNECATNADGTRLIFSATLETDNCLHKEDMVRIINKMVFPTDDDTYTGTGIIPDRYFIPFKSYLRIYIAYRPDTVIQPDFNNYMLTENEIYTGFLITDMYEISEQFQFIRDVSDVFSTTLEVITSSPIWPKYTQNIQMRYDTPVYQKDDNGFIAVDENGNPIVLHAVGDLVFSPTGDPVYAHREGEDIIKFDPLTNKPVYSIPPKYTFLAKKVPLIAMTTMLNPVDRELLYTKLKTCTDVLQKRIIPKLIENTSISVGLCNTVGPSTQFIQGYGDAENYTRLPNLSMSVTLNCKIRDPDMAPVMQKNIIQSTQVYIRQIMQSSVFNTDGLLLYLRELYSDIVYIEFESINGADSKVQTIKLSDLANQDTVVVPEYITVDQKLDEDAFKQNGTISTTPNIVVNMIL